MAATCMARSLASTSTGSPDAEVASHKLMIRAGLIRKLSSGTYTYLPLGWRCLLKVMEVIRQEMNAAGAQEILMPAVQPVELWQQTGRDADYGAAVMTNGNGGGALYGEILRSIARVYEWTDYAPVEFASFEAMVDEYRRIHAERPDDPRVAESRLNSLGYGVLGEGLTDQALSIMRLNASLYPHSANCYDSLADAYEASGDYYNALLNSRKAIAMLDRYPMENLHWQHLRETASQRIWLLEDEFVPLKEGKE